MKHSFPPQQGCPHPRFCTKKVPRHKPRDKNHENTLDAEVRKKFFDPANHHCKKPKGDKKQPSEIFETTQKRPNVHLVLNHRTFNQVHFNPKQTYAVSVESIQVRTSQ